MEPPAIDRPDIVAEQRENSNDRDEQGDSHGQIQVCFRFILLTLETKPTGNALMLFERVIFRKIGSLYSSLTDIVQFTNKWFQGSFLMEM